MSVLRLRAQLVRYAAATAASATITLGLPILLHEVFGVADDIAVAVALAVAFIVNFVSTRVLVFRSTGRASGELLRFALTSLSFRGLEYLAYLALAWAGVVYYLALAIVLAVSMVLKFLTYRSVVFNRSVDRAA